jgi:hypothetical protein
MPKNKLKCKFNKGDVVYPLGFHPHEEGVALVVRGIFKDWGDHYKIKAKSKDGEVYVGKEYNFKHIREHKP